MGEVVELVEVPSEGITIDNTVLKRLEKAGQLEVVLVGKTLGVAMKAEGLSPDVFAHVLYLAITDHFRDMQKCFGPAFLAEP